ncbi:MAG: hypothetical protein HUJ72_10290 [Blautia sp.]|nr:hypothetical protein [Blautia sp.]
MGMILLVVELILLFDTWIMKGLLAQGMVYGNAYVFFIVLMILVLVYAIWCFASAARFENSVINLLKNSLVLMIRHPGTSIRITFYFAFCCLVIWLIPVLLLIMPVLTVWLASASIEKVFEKYRKE